VNDTLARQRFEEALSTQEPAFERFFLARFLDLQIGYGDGSSDDEECCRVALPVADYMNNPQGSLHGGIIALVMDVSMGHLCHRFLSTAVTLEMKLQFLRPVKGDCIAVGRFLKKGRRVVYIESRLTNEAGKLASVANATWQRLEPGSAP
jgi:uncharacterized protein (TIGR00369 family)